MIRTRPLESARAGDQLDGLYRAARALTGSAQEADDLVHDTCTRVLSQPCPRSEIPIGTVMSRLYRARGQLAAQFAACAA